MWSKWFVQQVMGLGSNGEEEMSTVQQPSSSSNVSICKFAIPLEQFAACSQTLVLLPSLDCF